MNAAVIGIGAMGGGIARALLASDETRTVSGYDRDGAVAAEFHEESRAAGKAGGGDGRDGAAGGGPPGCIGDAVGTADVVFLVLVNEGQCEAVCFGAGDGDDLISTLSAGSCVVLCSTVTATWARAAASRFRDRGILFVDCPVSGGPARARSGDLTMMASGDGESLSAAMPLLEAAGREVHVIPGGAGMGSTVKMVHQLLAGVHICAAAEALALAAKAGVDVDQMYNIVLGAAGNSWMFADRGQRMIAGGGEPPDVMSALDIFVKDLDIVHTEARAVQCPIPVASAALQQFVSGQSLGYGRDDDSQVIKVYERITGVPAVGGGGAKEEAVIGGGGHDDDGGGEDEDVWRMDDGTEERIVGVAEEPNHRITLHNEYVRVFIFESYPGYTTLAHRHVEDSLYVFLVEGGLDFINHVKGSAPESDFAEFGEVRYCAHKTDKPLVQKLTNRARGTMLCVDAEVLGRPPVVSGAPLCAEYHELLTVRDKCRVYELSLEPGQSVTVNYVFFYLVVVLEGGLIEVEMNGLRWRNSHRRGDTCWKEPCMGLKQTNVGDALFKAYICEWR